MPNFSIHWSGFATAVYMPIGRPPMRPNVFPRRIAVSCPGGNPGQDAVRNLWLANVSPCSPVGATELVQAAGGCQHPDHPRVLR